MERCAVGNGERPSALDGKSFSNPLDNEHLLMLLIYEDSRCCSLSCRVCCGSWVWQVGGTGIEGLHLVVLV